jgi:mRNA interferase MazF
MSSDTPPRIKPRLKSAPKIRQIYWCDFPVDAHLPEFWKTRPVIILSKTARLYGCVLVVPCSTQAQQDTKTAFPLRTTIDGRAAWAICDKVTTVAVSRLALDKKHGIVCMPREEFDEMLTVVLNFLPSVGGR